MIQDELKIPVDEVRAIHEFYIMSLSEQTSFRPIKNHQFTCMILNAKYNAFFPWNKILMLYNNLYVKYHKIKQPWDSIQWTLHTWKCKPVTL